jgi:D-sedoheptulose 7-phosphate isomerase
MLERIKALNAERIALFEHLSGDLAQPVLDAAEAVAKALSRDNKVLVFGNGGSAADAQHIAAEFVGRFERERGPLPAIALTTDTSALTAIANDYGFEEVFSRQVGALANSGDVVIAISTSGNSSNVLSAVTRARELGATTIGLTGGTGGKLAASADIPLVIPSDSTARIQEAHIAVGHTLCALIDGILSERNLAERPGAEAVVELQELLELRASWKKQGRSVVWTNGVFDLIHPGHLRSLRRAKELGDVLVVGVNSDPSVSDLKGPGRPILSASQRAEMLGALEPVDKVIIFEERTPERILSEVQPDIHVKGDEYAPDRGGKEIPEAAVVEAYGGKVVFLPVTPEVSTSDLIDRIRRLPDES